MKHGIKLGQSVYVLRINVPSGLLSGVVSESSNSFVHSNTPSKSADCSTNPKKSSPIVDKRVSTKHLPSANIYKLFTIGFSKHVVCLESLKNTGIISVTFQWFFNSIIIFSTISW